MTASPESDRSSYFPPQPYEFPIRIPKLRVKSQSNVVVTLREQTPLFQSHDSGLDNSNVSPPSTGTSTGSQGRRSTPIQSPPIIRKTKTKAGLMGFLTLKEPSQAAFEEFAQSQRRQQAPKDSKPTSMSGSAHKKLPDCVPKVNSKWDGMPDNAHERSKEFRSSGDPWRRNLESRFSGNRLPQRSNSHSKPSKTSSHATPYTGGSKRPTFEPHRAFRSQDTTRSRTSQWSFSSTASPAISPGDSTPPLPSPALDPKIDSDLHVSTISSTQGNMAVKSVKPNPISSVEQPHHVVNKVAVDSYNPEINAKSFHPPTSEKSSDGSPQTSTDMQVQPGHANRANQEVITIVSSPSGPDENPQWPLPATMDEAIFKAAGPDVLSAPLAIKSENGSLGSGGFRSRSNSIEVNEDAIVDNTPVSSGFNSPPTSPLSSRKDERQSPRNFTRPFNQPKDQTPPKSTPKNSPRSVNRVATNSFLGLRASPNQIGVPISTDSNLPTIPESDNASARLSVLSKGVPNTSDPAEDGLNTDALSQKSSRASSDLSTGWYLSPKDRLGLGGFVKHQRKDSPWPPPSKEDEEYVMGRRNVSPSDDRERTRRRTALKGVFKSK